MRFKIARLSQFIATAKSLATELADLQPTDLGPESVEYALDSDFAASGVANAEGRGSRGSDLDNRSTNVSEGSATQSIRSVRGTEPVSENYYLHGGDEVAEAREARIRAQNEQKLEQLFASSTSAENGTVGGSTSAIPRFGSDEQRVVCEGEFCGTCSARAVRPLQSRIVFFICQIYVLALPCASTDNLSLLHSLCTGPLIQVHTDSGRPQRRHFRLFYASPPRFRGPFLCCHEVAFSPFHDYDQHNHLLRSRGSKLPDGQGDGRLLASFDLTSTDCLELAGSTTFSDDSDATGGQAAVKAVLAEAAAARGSVGDGVWYGFVIRAGHEIKLLAFADSEAERLRWVRAIDTCLESFANAEQRLQQQQEPHSEGAATPPPLPDPQRKIEADVQSDGIRRKQLLEEAEIDRVMEDVRRRQEQRTSNRAASRPTKGEVVATGSGSVVVSANGVRASEPQGPTSINDPADRWQQQDRSPNGSQRTGNSTAIERAARTPIPRRPAGDGFDHEDNNSSERSRSDSGSEKNPSVNRRLNRRFSVGGSLIAGASASPHGERGWSAAKEGLSNVEGATSRTTSRSEDEERGLRALLGIPESHLVDVLLQPGSLGCVMEEQDAPSGVPVVVIDALRPHVQAGTPRH